MPKYLASLAGIALSWALNPGQASPLKTDEEIVFFPTAAALSTDGTQWLVPVHGWVFEKEADSPLRRALIETLRASQTIAPTGDDARSFRQRAEVFTVDNERGKEISIRAGDRSFPCQPSEANGHFRGEFGIPRNQGRPGEWIAFTARLPAGDRRSFAGRAQLVPPGAAMVVSDIDDTVKVTEGWNQEKRIANTFTRPFEPVKGMAEAYQSWAQKGAVFHYVSGSPWQMYPFFADGFDRAGLPRGAFTMQLFRLTDESFLAFLSSPEDYKVKTISSIIDRYPKSAFILVGDSGEKDPEVYGKIARKYPGRIANVFIRDVSVGESQAGRFEKAFRGLPPTRWHIFKTADDLLNAPEMFK